MSEARKRECTECGFEYYGRRERCNDCHEPETPEAPWYLQRMPEPYDKAVALLIILFLVGVVFPLADKLQWFVERARRIA